MILNINNQAVISSIIEILDLPINKQCQNAILYETEIIFITDEWDENQQHARFPLWWNMEIRWWGIEFSVMNCGDIKHYEIDCKNGDFKMVCGYTKEGRIKYEKSYIPSLD